MPSVIEFRANKPSQLVEKKYYNRPKFLQAPDPSTLATPSFGVAGEKNCGTLPSLASLLSGPAQPMPPGFVHPVWYGDNPSQASYRCPSPTFLSSGQVNSAFFPAPPTLEDIQRMEPDLSPESVMKRVGTIDALRSNAYDHIALAPSRPSAPGSLADRYSPIMRPLKRARTSSAGQHWFPQDLVDSIRFDQRLTYKRLRVEADDSVLLAKWYTDYLINTLTKTQFRDKGSPNTYVYNKLWRNVATLLWDFGLSESVVLLALWYIHRLFPNGFMHPGVFSRSEGGIIAWRIFLLGNLLAEKWLEDSIHGFSSWQPYFELPSNSVKVLERTFLQLLGYNIYISNTEWQDWIGKLQIHCRAEFLAGHSKELQCSFMDMLHELLDEAKTLAADSDRKRFLYEAESKSYQLVLSLLGPCALDEGLEFSCIPPLLRQRTYSTAWNPAADPIVSSRPRASEIAPIARPITRSAPLVAFLPSISCNYCDWRRSGAHVGEFGDGFHTSIMT